MAIPIIYNIRNLWVRKVSTLLTVAGIALATGVLLVVLMLVSGLRYALIESGSAENAILLRKSAQSETMSGIGREAADIIKTSPEIASGRDGSPLVTTETVVGVNLLRRGQEGARSGSNVTVRGITPASLALREKVSIVEGRAPTPGLPEILAGLSASKGFQNCEVGGVIPMSGIDWTVVGIFEADGTSFESELWGDNDLLINAFGRQAGFSSLTLALDPDADIEAMQARFDEDPRVNVEVQRERAYYEGSALPLTMLLSILGSVLVILFSLGAVLGAMVTMFAFVGSRTKEIGTLRALGFRRRSILTCFLIESVLLALAGGILACVPALFVQQLTFSTTNFSSFTDLTWHFRATPGILISGLVFAVVMGALGGLIPAVRAALIPITSALREA